MVDCEKSDCQSDESNCEFCGEIVNWLFYDTECDRDDCGHRNDQCSDCLQGSCYLSPDDAKEAYELQKFDELHDEGKLDYQQEGF